MAVIDSIQSTTGHNRAQERNVAKILYTALIVAVVLGFIFFFSLGHKKTMDPTHPEQGTATSQPATPSDTQ